MTLPFSERLSPELRNRLPHPPSRPHLIASDSEAIDIARGLAEEFAERASQRDQDRDLPWDEVELFTASGLGGMTVPREFGGAQVSNETVAQVMAALAAADASLAQIPQNQLGVLTLVREIGSPAQQARIFGDVLAGHRIGNAGPERHGRAVTHVTTRVRRVDGKLRLTGRRFYSTGALFAHWIPTRALDENDRPVQVWVRRDAEGVRVLDDWDGFGQRTTASGSVVFDGAAVDEGLLIDLSPLVDRPVIAGPSSQLIHVAIDAGIARGAVEAALDFVRTKTRAWPFTVQSATEDPYIIGEIGRLQVDLHAAEEAMARAARILDRVAAKPVTAESSAEASVAVAEAKILTTEIAVEASEHLLELAGSSATRAAYNLGRYWRDARVHTLHDPVRWKYHLLGNYTLNGVLPNRHQWN